MPQPNDLSRSLVALDQNSTIIAVVELSQSSWLVAGMLPGIERQPHKKLEPSPERLLALLHRWRDEAVRAWAQRRRIRHGAPQDTADFAAPRLDLVLVMTRPANSPGMLTALLGMPSKRNCSPPLRSRCGSLRLTGRSRSAASQEVRSLLDERGRS